MSTDVQPELERLRQCCDRYDDLFGLRGADDAGGGVHPALSHLGPESSPSIDFMFRQFEGVKEIRGGKHDPLVLAAHKYGARAPWFDTDEIPWCSSIACLAAEWCDRIHPGSARARSWLLVGETLTLDEWIECLRSNDVEVARNTMAIFNRGGPQDPAIIKAKGHVAQLLAYDPNDDELLVRGGNQSNEVNQTWYKRTDLLGLRYCPSLY